MGNENSGPKKHNSKVTKKLKKMYKGAKNVSKKAKESIIPKVDREGLTQAQRDSKAEEHKKAGNLNFQSQFYDRAIEEYKKALKYKESSILHSNIARCYLCMEETEKCIENCALALSLDQENFKAILMLGDSSIKMAFQEMNPLFIDEGIQYYNKAIKICQKSTKPINIGEISNIFLNSKIFYWNKH